MMRLSVNVSIRRQSHEKAIEMILNGECGVFNPILMECLVDIKDKIHKESQLEVLR